MSEINHFKVLVLYSGDVVANVDHLHVKKIHLVSSSYIVIEDYALFVISVVNSMLCRVDILRKRRKSKGPR
jgi:hypothetical protein